MDDQKEKRPIDETIEELRSVEEFSEEDSQVNVVVHAPPKTLSPTDRIFDSLRDLPPVGRVIVLLALIAAVTFAGVAGFTLSGAFGK